MLYGGLVGVSSLSGMPFGKFAFGRNLILSAGVGLFLVYPEKVSERLGWRPGYDETYWLTE